MPNHSGASLPPLTPRQDAARRLPALRNGVHDPADRSPAAPTTSEIVSRANTAYWALYRKLGDDTAALAALRSIRDATNHLIDLTNAAGG